MKRYDINSQNEVENVAVDNFLKDILRVYEKHKMTLAHEDQHGAFLIENLNQGNIGWLLSAHVNLFKEPSNGI